MMKPLAIALDDIYVPVRLRGTLVAEKVAALAEDILQNGLRLPIQVRVDKQRYVIVTGLHRLEAVRALGETTIAAFVVSARRV